MAEGRLAQIGLLDVLDQLPRGDLRRSIWMHLGNVSCAPPDTPPGTHLGRPFRLVSRQSRRLADQLTRRLALGLPTGDDREATQSSQAAFLRRLEGLEVLILDGKDVDSVLHPADNVEFSISKTLLQGRDTFRHLHTLQLNSPVSSACSDAVGTAIQLCCPQLRELVLEVPDPGAAFFAPLRKCPDLQKVTIDSSPAGGAVTLSGEAVCALAALPHLRDLTLCGNFDPKNIPLLAGLTCLQQLRATHLALHGPSAPYHGSLGSALSHLTQLTVLQVPWWADDDEDSTALNANVAQLGGLLGLVELAFDGANEFDIVHGDACLAILGLTALTRLSCPPLGLLPHASSGHLPQLQALHIMGSPDSVCLATAFRPFLPLPSLHHIHFSARESDQEDGVVGDFNGVQATAAWQAATILAKLPRLEGVRFEFDGDWKRRVADDQDTASSRTTGLLTAFCVPLRDVLTHLTLSCLPQDVLEAAWPVLCLASLLRSLTLESCDVSESRLLMAVGQHMGLLERLCVSGCEGVSGGTVLALAGVRMRPLCITWDPALNAEQCQVFTATARPGVTVQCF